MNKLIKIDKDVGRTILELSKLSILKEALLKSDSNIDLEKSLLYNNKKISDIDFYFTLPGTNINLKQNGSEIQVNSYNFEEYINLVVEMVCRKGIEEYVLSFKCGFNQVFDINCLKCFQSSEIEEIFCGSSKDQWDYSTLMQNIIPNHGYDKNSNIFKNMINILTEMTTEERKKFLLFVTGCPRLPLGGFKNLYPKLTIVKKNPDQPRDNPNNYLPTVMT